MDLSEFYDEMFEDTSKQEIQIVENQLVLAKNLQKRIIEFEQEKKAIESAEKTLKQQLEQVMGDNNISSFETTDKKIKISYTPPTMMETFDKEKLFLDDPDTYKKYVRETPKKASVRITIRGDENGI